MNDSLRDQIQKNFELKETSELLQIWETNDHVEWSILAFEVLEEILRKRVDNLPPQNEPILEHKSEKDDDDLEDWEARVLDNEKQPEFYDTLEVLSLKDNIDKTAKAVVIIYILLSILKFQTTKELLLGVYPSTEEITGILWSLFITILGTGIAITIVYFPLKALSHILRILMEMEFNSRKAK
jgi:hypothetical protein